MCSNENFRKYNAICKSEEGREKEGMVFATRTPALYLAAAIGLNAVLTGQIELDSIKREKEKQLTRREYIVGNNNYKIFKTIIQSKHGELSDPDILEQIMTYAAYGITELYDEYHKTGDIDFIRISKSVRKDD